MRKIPEIPRQELLFGSSDKAQSYKISSLEKKGLIKRIAPKIYTSNLADTPHLIIRRNWYRILANQYPNALISYRTALEYKPTADGHIYVTYSYNRNLVLPGLTIHFIKGPQLIDGDNRWFEKLYVSQEARAFLENLQVSRKKEESKSLQVDEIEKRLDSIIRIRGEAALHALRDKAREIAPILGLEIEFAKLNKLISALLTTHTSGAKILSSSVAKARILGEPFDPGRILLFEKLYNALTDATFPVYEDKNSSPAAYKNFAFFEGYFSNYIEGTIFEISEAKEIIKSETPLPERDEDSHDILGTYQIVSAKNEMSIVPSSGNELLDILRKRHSQLLSARLAKKPGYFKDKNNRVGDTEFVDMNLVTGTLKKGFEWYSLLREPFAKAAYMMLLISEVHPFLDGNGRIARVMMNAELSSKGLSKIIIPNVYREDYLGSLKRFSQQEDPDVYIKMLLRAYEFSANVFADDMDTMEQYLIACDAFKEPKNGRLKIMQH